MAIKFIAADLGGPPEGPSELMEKGWVYRDLPRTSPEIFDEFAKIAGDANLKWLAKADYGTSKRGQVMISPEGIKRLQEWNSSRDAGEA